MVKGTDMMRKLRGILSIVFLLALICSPALLYPGPQAGRASAGDQLFDELGPEELKSGRYFYMLDEKGRTILTTGHRLRAKDRYLTADNDLYEVESIGPPGPGPEVYRRIA